MICVYFGSPGCGKTTHIMYMIKKQIKVLSKWTTKIKRYPKFMQRFIREPKQLLYFTNVKDCVFPFYPSSDLGKSSLPPKSVYYLDEAGIDFNNRSYKSLSKETIAYFKLHRHYKHDINVYSQSWEDMDVTIRRLADRYYYLKKIGPFTLCRQVKKVVTIDRNTEQIIDGYKFCGILWRLLPRFMGGFKSFYFVFRPLYYDYFDSYSIEHPLPAYNIKPRPLPVTHGKRRIFPFRSSSQ